MALASIRLRNLLSFRDLELELHPLNVLIGPNASGKTNLIDAIALLRAAPENFRRALARGGLPRDWIWKGADKAESAELEIVLDAPVKLGYRMEFEPVAESTFEIVGESLRRLPEAGSAASLLFDRRLSEVTIYRRTADDGARVEERERILPQQSALELLASPLVAEEPAVVSKLLRSVRIYRGWDTSADSAIRRGGLVFEPGAWLEEEGSNLPVVLNQLEPTRNWSRIEGYLRNLLEGFEKLHTTAESGALFLRIRERNLGLIPATRLSDGTLRFLCLMAALFHPEPPPLICIEEPEIGLHPDALQLVAEALQEASQRTQIIVTTHSEALVDALTAVPESILVCEKDFDNSTRIERLDAGRLARWLERYRLGELWRKGEIGGNRW